MRDSHDRLDDAELLARVGGPEGAAAFGALYRRHEAAVLAFLRRRVASPEVAADLCAETFASALAAAPRYDPALAADGSALGWLVTIAHNTLRKSLARGRVADHARRRLRFAEPLLLTDDALERVDALASLPEALGAAVERLPAAQREAVLARVVDERPYPEIAAELACSELVVRQRVSRGLAKLRAAIEEAHDPGASCARPVPRRHRGGPMTVVFPQLEQQLMAAAAGPDARPARRRRSRFLRGGLPLLAGAVLVAGSAAAATGLWTPLSSPAPARPAIEVAKERLSVLRRGPNVIDDPRLAQHLRLARRLSSRNAKALPIPVERTPAVDQARLARVDGRYRTFVLTAPNAVCVATTKVRSNVGGLVCWTQEDQLRELADGRMGTSAEKVDGGWRLSVLVPDGTRDAALTFADGAPRRVENPVPTVPPLPPHP